MVTQAAAPLPETKTPLPGAPKTFITTAPEEDTEIKHVYEYFIGLKILMFAWIYVGNFVCESKREKGAKVIFMSLSAAYKYADDAYDCAMRAITSDRLRWLRDRDWATRSRMTELMRAPYKWPAVEALDKALDEYRNQWYPGELRSVDGDGKEINNSESESGRNKRSRSADGDSGRAPKEGVDILSTIKDGGKICDGYNAGTCSGVNCSKKKMQRCNLLTGEGIACGGFHQRTVYHKKVMERKHIVG